MFNNTMKLSHTIQIIKMSKQPEYSEKFSDDEYEYRQVILPRELGNQLKGRGLLSEDEWRGLGVTQSRGWVHYGYHPPEPHILLFRRRLGTDPRTGEVDTVLRENIAREAEAKRRSIRNSYK